MKNISSHSRLQTSIMLLEEEQIIKRQLLKEQLNKFFDSIKPLNLISSMLKDISSTPDLRDNVLGSAMGLASGFLSKKLFIAGSGNILRKIIGLFLQIGITNIVAKHPDAIKTFGKYIVENFLTKKEVKTKQGVS